LHGAGPTRADACVKTNFDLKKLLKLSARLIRIPGKIAIQCEFPENSLNSFELNDVQKTQRNKNREISKFSAHISTEMSLAGGAGPEYFDSLARQGGMNLPKMSRVAPPAPSAVCFDEPCVPAFLLKLYTMLEDPNTDDIISWSPSGDSFVVHKHAEFSTLMLPQFFKHSNFQSFVRQVFFYNQQTHKFTFSRHYFDTAAQFF
jgi:hypothetical protein